MKQCCEKYLMEQFGDDLDIVCEIYAEYTSSLALKVVELKNAIDSEDWTQVDRLAHTVKGNALAAGDEDVATVAIELRKTAALKDAAQCRTLLAKIEALAKTL